ncbi:MAG: metalloprotease TldD, partial [Alphaproteobacteria bacterium]
MTDIAVTEDLFFTRAGLDRATAGRIVDDALAGADDGELYLEYRQSESINLDDGCIKSASFDSAQGFGLRAVVGEAAGYAHASDLSEAALRRAAETVKAVRSGRGGVMAGGPIGTNQSLYTDLNPLSQIPFDTKVKLLGELDAYARGRDPRVVQVMASLSASWQAVHILRAGGDAAADIRPLVRISVAIVCADGDRRETGSYGAGGRVGYGEFLTPARWQAAVDEALR